MKTKLRTGGWMVLLALSAFNQQLSTAFAQGTAFTYQGRLNSGANPVVGIYDLRFTIYDAAGGGSAGGVLTNAATPVTNGLFTVTLDFGSGVFTGPNRWLEIAVRTNGATSFVTLTPRQALTPSPYAIFAGKAGGLSGTLPVSQVSGVVPLAQLPVAVMTNNATGVTLSGNLFGNFGGSFTGNGGGLTNVTAATLAIPPGMALIPGGTFTMGDNLDGGVDANPTNITVSAFYLDVNLVSYAQWQSVYFWATNHGYGFVDAGAGKAANHPVQTVNWYDSMKWCNARSQQAGRTPVYYRDPGFTQVYTNGDNGTTVYPNWAANGYRLPTEAEWEKAARGGLSGQRFPWGNVITENLANYNGATASYSYDLGPNGYNTAFTNGLVQPYTSPVGYFAPNGYGLNDMTGNVFEWCWDRYGTPYGQPTTTNPTGPATGSYRVLRGGSWNYYAYYARCGDRVNDPPNYADFDVGFRCVRGL